jgi:hypothetical protein
MCVSSSGRAAEFFSAGDTSLSKEVSDSKISVQSACALNTVYLVIQFMDTVDLNLLIFLKALLL